MLLAHREIEGNAQTEQLLYVLVNRNHWRVKPCALYGLDIFFKSLFARFIVQLDMFEF
jgi:hypothetical protein